MTDSVAQRAAQFYAQTYDLAASDWPGEIDFYRQLAAQASSAGKRVLEVACGTGRVAIRLAQDGVEILGLDISAPMLQVAKAKSAGLPSMRWVHGDMRSFDLGETFGLVLIPGHALQNLLAIQGGLIRYIISDLFITGNGPALPQPCYGRIPWKPSHCRAGEVPGLEKGKSAKDGERCRPCPPGKPPEPTCDFQGWMGTEIDPAAFLFIWIWRRAC